MHILRNNLRKAALEKRVAELKSASPEQRETILAEIDHDIQEEMRRVMEHYPAGGRVIF